MRKRFISDDAVFFITGCSSGFGRAMAQYAADCGFNIVATARNLTDLEYLKEYKNVFPVKLDITDIDSINSAVAAAATRFGKIDILINNAGINYIVDLRDYESEKMQLLFDTNIIAPINVTRAALPYIPNDKHSAIINMSSMSGLDTGFGTILYGISKHAVNGLTQGLRNTKHYDIRVASVNPGKFGTDIRKKSLERPGLDKDQIMEKYLSQYLGDVNIAARDIIDMTIQRKDLPLYIVLGHGAIKRYKKLICEMRKDCKFLRSLPTNKIHESFFFKWRRRFRKYHRKLIGEK